MDSVTVTIPHRSAVELDRLLALVEPAVTGGAGLSANQLASADLTDEALAAAHTAIHQAL
ncbi:MAG: hypothetical protein JWM89_4046 [Acidimicrobiales bacterium]|nr:hypothetical protein [Acidimicrobiales bacterium]